MSAIIDGLVNGFDKNKSYGERLLSDLSNEQMTMQPAGDRELPTNHPAWTFSHMNIYLPVIQAVIKGEPFEDTKGHRFGQESQPQSDPSLYATRDEILQEWVNGHEQVCELLSNSTDAVFEQPIELERWREIMPNAGILLPYLMLNHENQHLGQISTWRRVMGLPRV